MRQQNVIKGTFGDEQLCYSSNALIFHYINNEQLFVTLKISDNFNLKFRYKLYLDYEKELIGQRMKRFLEKQILKRDKYLDQSRVLELNPN